MKDRVMAVLMLAVLSGCSGCPEAPETKIYAACRCRPGAADCKDSMAYVGQGAMTERCEKGAALEVVCVGGGCPGLPSRDGGR